MRIADLFETNSESLAKPELIDWMNHHVAVNPTPGMLARMLRDDRYHEVRIITLGNDIATCPSFGIIHQDMGSALAHQSHPAWRNRQPLWYMGEGCWFLNVHPEGAIVNDKHGRVVPPAEWPLGLTRALAGTPIAEPGEAL